MRKTHTTAILLVSALLVGCAEAETATRPAGKAPATPVRSRTGRAERPPSGTAKVTPRADAQPAKPLSDQRVLLPHCLVSLIYEAQVPAEDAGVLTEIVVREGAQVSTHDLLAKIDDTHARMQLDVAENKLAVAKEQAENDIHVRYAQAAADVAKAELDQALEANRKHPGTVTRAEVWRLQLTWKRAAQPLVEFCRHPHRAPDKAAMGKGLGNPFYLSEIARLQALVEGYERGRFIRLMRRVDKWRRRFCQSR